MSEAQFAPITVVLQASAPLLPSFGISVIAAELDSQQLSKFLTLSGGLSTVPLTAQSAVETLDAIGVGASEIAFVDVVDHFGEQRKPERSFLTYRGVAEKLHIQTVTLSPETGSATQAAVGDYRIFNIEGGPYTHQSPGVAQVTDLEIIDAGGGFGATGRYEVSDAKGNSYVYESGGTNIWKFVVTVATAGSYTVTDTVAGETYTYVATGADTVTTIRDGMLAEMNNLISHPAGHPNWITNTSGVDTVTMSGSSIGLQLAFTSNLGPGGIEATIDEIGGLLVPETVGAIATALDAVITGVSPPPPIEWSTGVAAGIITATAFTAFIGQDLAIKIAGPAAPDATTTITTDHRETVTTVITALNAKVTAETHPTFTDSFADPVITLTGTVVGAAVVVEVSSPQSTLVLAETQSTITLRKSQVTRVTIIAETGTDAFVGGYTLSLFGENIMHTSGVGDSITVVRDAIQAKVDGDPTVGGETSTLAVGTDSFDITMTKAGIARIVTIASPGSNSGATVSTQAASLGAADDFDRAIVDEDTWYFWLMRGSQTDQEAITLHVDNVAAATPRRAFFQTADTGYVDDPRASSDGIAEFIKASGTRRSFALFDPIPSSDVQSQQGMYTAWVGGASTYQPGQVQWHAFELTGVSGGQKLSAIQEFNVTDKSGGFVEFIGSLNGGAGGRITNAPYNADGTLLDITRALDQIRAVYQLNAVALLAGSAILPYTNQGISQINGMIQTTTKAFISQGLVVANSFQYLPNGRVPEISDATPLQAQQGIFPTFNFSIKIQLGGVQIRQEILVTQ